MSGSAVMTIDVPAVVAFDYSMVAAAAAADLRRTAAAIRATIGKTTACIIEVGRHLADVKERLDHGAFETWVQSEAKIAVRTAQAYMAAARLADTKGATVALLPPTTMHRLAQKSAPADVVDIVVHKAEVGEIVPDAAVVEMLAQARQRQREAGRQARETAAKAKRKGRRAAADRKRAEYEAQCEREREAAQEAAKRILQRLGEDAARLLLADLDDGPGTHAFRVLDFLRKAVST